MKFRGSLDRQIGFEKLSKLLLFGLILLCGAQGGCASLPVGSKETVRTFPNFAVVLPEEGDTFSSLSAKYLKDPSLDWWIAEYNEIDSLIPGQPVIIPFNPPAKGGLTLQGYQTVPILSYHNFSPAESSKVTVNQAMFEEQMRLLHEKGYRVISIDQLFDFLDLKTSIPPKSVVITFDDGWISAYEIAFPILKRYGYPASLFIYTDTIDNAPKTLSWDQLKEMAAQGIDVQCHTKSHRNLTLAGKNESFKDYFENLGKELSDCRQIIKEKLNLEVRYLAYPYGETNALIIELAKKLGYRGAFTAKGGGNPFFIHNYRVNRFEIHGDFTLSQFEKNLIIFQERAVR
jgi:peptidoglycan/xylan/chitin deacetylase (PgdA/CDA1 family)